MPFEILFFQKFIDKILQKPLLCISSAAAATVDIFVKIPTTDSIVFILVYVSVM